MMEKESFKISYNNHPHLSMSIHRQLLCFEPMALTTDGAFRDMMIEAWEENESKETLVELLESDFYDIQSVADTLPVSYIMLYKVTQLNWINLIIESVFKKELLEKFATEYKMVIEDIYHNSSIYDKEYSVFRDINTGSSIFETAARVYLLSEYSEMIDSLDSKSKARASTLKRLNKVLKCYKRIGEFVGDPDIILGITDLSGATLRESLNQYCKNMLSGRE